MREISKIPLLFLTLILLGSGCISEKDNTGQPNIESIEILPEVVFSVVGNEPLLFYIESRGVVEPIQKIQITPRIGGFVKENKIIEGKEVRKGEVLLQFNQEEWELHSQEAYHTYIAKKNEYEIEMRLRNGTSGTNGNELVKITTGLADAEIAYERAKLNLSYTTIEAPFSGYISTKEIVTNGAYVGAGKELGILINTNRVKIRFDVLESEIVQLKKGISVELENPSGAKHEGRIIAISPEIDKESKTGQAVVEVNNPDGKLRTGMTVEGRIFVRSMEGKVKMPRAALLERDGRTLVFKLYAGEVHWVYVTPEGMTTDWVLINHNEINPGDTLAVDKHFSISHQQQVLPVLLD